MIQPSLRRFTLEEIEKIVEDAGEKKFRSKQLYQFLFHTKTEGWESQNNLPNNLVKNLSIIYPFTTLSILSRTHSEKDNTTKYLYQTQAGEKTESVIIRKKDRVTACLSSQVGCKFACRFCVSGSRGLFRNMDASEIVDQFYLMQQAEGERITNLVMMGMGEPFDNYEEVVKALRIIKSKEGFDLGARHITVSTVGVPEGIAKFAKENLGQIKLAWSLHAADNEKREKLMPVNKKWNIEKVRDAFKENREAFKKMITFEYILFRDINDTDLDARNLAVLANDIGAKVNLIQYNPTGFGLEEGVPFKATRLDRLRAFRKILDDKNVVNTLRKSGGSDVGAACGQLSLQNLEGK